MRRINVNETVTRDGLIYHQDTNKPVTGIVEEFHENGQLMGRGNFIDGKREGLFEYFDEDGNLTDTRTYRVSR
jgi:antitoxin component YwqK of YwqJK toxin-antitoxin module